MLNGSFGLYGNGMHDFILDEEMLGFRVACGLDAENNCGMGVWVDLSYQEYCRKKGWVEGDATPLEGL